MPLWIAVVYGLVQGITEFLPISSSGHLALLPHFIGFEDPGVFFDLTMHIGTALAVMIYFHKQLLGLVKGAGDLWAKPRSAWGKDQWLLINISVATLMTVILALFFKDITEAYGRSPKMIALNLFLFGLIMWWADKKANQEVVALEAGEMVTMKGFPKAMLIGLFQAIALFPGVSRSGATLSISRVMNLSRQEAANFSFLLSLPIILAGFVYKLKEALQGSLNVDWTPYLVGGFVAFVVGLTTIHLFIKFISRIGLLAFAWYRMALALVVLAVFVF